LPALQPERTINKDAAKIPRDTFTDTILKPSAMQASRSPKPIELRLFMPLADGLYQRRCKKSIGSPVFWFNFQRLRAGNAPGRARRTDQSPARGPDHTIVAGTKRRPTATATA
jgi:hypothetical protein